MIILLFISYITQDVLKIASLDCDTMRRYGIVIDYWVNGLDNITGQTGTTMVLRTPQVLALASLMYPYSPQAVVQEFLTR